jgi:hypothetical protein
MPEHFSATWDRHHRDSTISNVPRKGDMGSIDIKQDIIIDTINRHDDWSHILSKAWDSRKAAICPSFHRRGHHHWPHTRWTTWGVRPKSVAKLPNNSANQIALEVADPK